MGHWHTHAHARTSMSPRVDCSQPSLAPSDDVHDSSGKSAPAFPVTSRSEEATV